MTKPGTHHAEQVEIYRCSEELEVNRVIDELLGPAEIECYVHDRTARLLPARGAEAGAFFIAVRGEDADRARSLLAQARKDGELDVQSGELLAD
jgi:hypothetical protein